MVHSNRANINSALFSTSPRAAYNYCFRADYQLKAWQKLGHRDLDSFTWGWEMKGSSYNPIMTVAEAGVTSHFVIPDTLCNNSLSHFVIPDAFCNT